jgi:hypothetical protein
MAMWCFAGYCGLAFVEATVFGASVASQWQTGELGAAILLGVLGIAPAANRWAERLFAAKTIPTDE